MMNNKYTFWELCNSYDKIEIPIIQRDYAQGRDTADVQKLRDKFINDYLIEAIVNDQNIELDFVYGSIMPEKKDDPKKKIFIPLDGQQRLTTLFLLYFLVGVKEKRLDEVKETLSRFTYETRPSAHDFCKALLFKMHDISILSEIKSEIEDSVWFNVEWENDPTVSGMLIMLDTLAKNEKLSKSKSGLLDRLINQENKFISFYFTDLDQFGLTENLYIRMNARGKMLTDFENFKSEFSKIIRYNHSLLEDIKNKIEYQWVDNLWDYRTSGSYTIDSPFMAFLSFVTEMLYFKDAEFRAKSYEYNFLDFKVLKDIYSIEENLKFLIFAFDFIKDVKDYNEAVLWEGESLVSILKGILIGRRDTNQLFVFFLTIIYCYNEKPLEHLGDFIRVARNLIENTDDNSRREWPRLISSLQNLISDKNVYHLLSELKDENLLIGFKIEQRKEEIFKSNLYLSFPSFQKDIFKIEDNKNFKGNISNILKSPFATNEKKYMGIDLSELKYNENKLNALISIFNGYGELSQNDFDPIWGNLLITGVYEQTNDSRLMYDLDYAKHPSILILAKNYALSKLKLKDYIIKIQKEFINKQMEYDDFSSTRSVKEQLYIYYIINERVYEKRFDSFFKNGYLNFGWLLKETGYKSFFVKGVERCEYFPSYNPIFQLYNKQFRYNLGINENNTLDIEIIGGNKKRDPFKLVIKWASQN